MEETRSRTPMEIGESTRIESAPTTLAGNSADRVSPSPRSTIERNPNPNGDGHQGSSQGTPLPATATATASATHAESANNTDAKPSEPMSPQSPHANERGTNIWRIDNSHQSILDREDISTEELAYVLITTACSVGSSISSSIEYNDDDDDDNENTGDQMVPIDLDAADAVPSPHPPSGVPAPPSLASQTTYPPEEDYGGRQTPAPPETSHGIAWVPHRYDGRRRPRRSSLKQSSTEWDTCSDPATASGVQRTGEDPAATSDSNGGSLYSVRMRGSRHPVQRRRSIEFHDTVTVQEVTPAVVLSNNNPRNLWLQADEVAAMKVHRRSLLRKYREKEALRLQMEVEEEAMKPTGFPREEVGERDSVVINDVDVDADVDTDSNADDNHNRHKKSNKMKNLMWNPTKRNFLNIVASSFSPSKNSSKNNSSSSSSSNSNDTNSSNSNSNSCSSNNNNNNNNSNVIVPSPSLLPSSSFGSNGSRSASSSSFGSMSNSNSSGSDTDSVRGLERYIDRTRTRVHKYRVWETVFVEQDEQQQIGCYDAEKIASLYRSVQVQNNSQQTVLERARKDRMDADSYLLTPRTMKLARIAAVPPMAPGAPLLTDAENIAPSGPAGVPPFPSRHRSGKDGLLAAGAAAGAMKPKTDTVTTTGAAKQCGGRFGIRRQFRRFSL